jgi:hypothetical protein
VEREGVITMLASHVSNKNEKYLTVDDVEDTVGHWFDDKRKWCDTTLPYVIDLAYAYRKKWGPRAAGARDEK